MPSSQKEGSIRKQAKKLEASGDIKFANRDWEGTYEDFAASAELRALANIEYTKNTCDERKGGHENAQEFIERKRNQARNKMTYGDSYSDDDYEYSDSD